MGFSWKNKMEIKARANNRSELSGETDFKLHAAHLNHNKDDTYRKIERGLLVTDIEHYAHHYMFQTNPSHIGLNKKENNRALKSMWCQVMYNHGSSKSLEEIVYELQYAIERWGDFYACSEDSLEKTVEST